LNPNKADFLEKFSSLYEKRPVFDRDGWHRCFARLEAFVKRLEWANAAISDDFKKSFTERYKDSIGHLKAVCLEAGVREKEHISFPLDFLQTEWNDELKQEIERLEPEHMARQMADIDMMVKPDEAQRHIQLEEQFQAAFQAARQEACQEDAASYEALARIGEQGNGQHLAIQYLVNMMAPQQPAPKSLSDRLKAWAITHRKTLGTIVLSAGALIALDGMLGTRIAAGAVNTLKDQLWSGFNTVANTDTMKILATGFDDVKDRVGAATSGVFKTVRHALGDL
jgi:hypothetical protein